MRKGEFHYEKSYESSYSGSRFGNTFSACNESMSEGWVLFEATEEYALRRDDLKDKFRAYLEKIVE